MAMIWWMGYINCKLTLHCISLITNSEAITLKCIVWCWSYKLGTELSSQVFYSLFITLLSEISLEKMLILNLHIEKVTPLLGSQHT